MNAVDIQLRDIEKWGFDIENKSRMLSSEKAEKEKIFASLAGDNEKLVKEQERLRTEVTEREETIRELKITIEN